MTSGTDTSTERPGTDDQVTGLKDEDIRTDSGVRAMAADDQDGTDGDSDADNTDA